MLYLNHKKDIKHVIGHSLGGFIANSINNDIESMRNKQVYIYNAPITGYTKMYDNVKDYSESGDIISAFDPYGKRKYRPIPRNIYKAHFTYKHNYNQ